MLLFPRESADYRVTAWQKKPSVSLRIKSRRAIHYKVAGIVLERIDNTKKTFRKLLRGRRLRIIDPHLKTEHSIRFFARNREGFMRISHGQVTILVKRGRIPRHRLWPRPAV